MAKRKDTDVKNVMRDVEGAVNETVRTFEDVAGEVVAASDDVVSRKLDSLIRAVDAVKAAAEEFGLKAGSASAVLTAKAGKVTSDIGSRAASVTDTVGTRATEVGAKASKRVQDQPWIVALMAFMLVVIVGISFGRRYLAEA